MGVTNIYFHVFCQFSHAHPQFPCAFEWVKVEVAFDERGVDADAELLGEDAPKRKKR